MRFRFEENIEFVSYPSAFHNKSIGALRLNPKKRAISEPVYVMQQQSGSQREKNGTIDGDRDRERGHESAISVFTGLQKELSRHNASVLEKKY